MKQGSLENNSNRKAQLVDEEKEVNFLSHRQLMWRAFKRHRLAMTAIMVLLILYLIAVFAGFFATMSPSMRSTDFIYAPPQIPHFVDKKGDFSLVPFVYGVKQEMDPETWARTYVIDEAKKYPLQFFIKGTPYKILGLIKSDIHLFGINSSDPFFLFGSDNLGRDLYSRIVYGTQISLSIGLVGVALSLIFGLLIGGVSGLFGGVVDLIIQRGIEILVCIPRIPLWMALSAALPNNWSSIKVYFAITVLLSLVGWTGIARVVRGKFMSLSQEDFVSAALAMGAGTSWIIIKHLIPNFMSYVLVNASLSIPWMILAETSLSFLGIGLRPPVVSWGVLLQEAQNMRTVSMHPWLLLPGIFVVIAVLAFNFVGDGLRDAADPYN